MPAAIIPGGYFDGDGIGAGWDLGYLSGASDGSKQQPNLPASDDDLWFRWENAPHESISRAYARRISNGWYAFPGSLRTGVNYHTVPAHPSAPFATRAGVRTLFKIDRTSDGTRAGVNPTMDLAADVVEGGIYYGSIGFESWRLTETQRMRAAILFADSLGNPIGTIQWGPAVAVQPRTPVRLITSKTVAPPGAVTAGVIVEDVQGTGWTAWRANESFWVYDAIITLNRLTPYFDGFQGGTWNGEPNASPSTALIQDTIIVDPLDDPDCPLPPAPPRPPYPDDTCLEKVTEWRRYWVVIPPGALSSNLEAVPVITISTGDQETRQVRIRVYPNPENLPPLEFEDFGAYIAELMVSYIGANATVILDGKTQRTYGKANGEISYRPADRLVYGPKGGPVLWPVLSCGSVGYLVAVDVPSSEPIGNLTVTVDLAGRY